MKKTKSSSRKRLPSIKSLQSKALELWKLICFKRDGCYCQVQKHYPNIQVKHTQIFQVDHCFTRNNKNLFLNSHNGTVVCSTCNMLKKYNSRSIHRLIDYIVIRREGQDMFDSMLFIDKSSSSNQSFTKREWLEQQIQRLSRELALLSG